MLNSYKQLKEIGTEAKKVIELLQKKGLHSKSDISEILEIKLTTLNRIMSPLLEQGIIVQQCIGESTGGRKPILYHINPDKYYVIGIDISRIYTQVVFVNFNMDIIHKEMFKMDVTYTPDKTIKAISEIIENIIKKYSIDSKKILGIGVGTVGPLDIEKGLIINPKNFISEGWKNIPIKSLLQEKLNYKVIVDNGTNAAVLLESLYGYGKGIKNVAYINCGIGIRTGVISSGHLVRTFNGAEDAFGHMIVDINGIKCNCGNYGCIECYCSIHAITDKFTSEIKKGRNSIIGKQIENIDFEQICKAAELNDELAANVIADAAKVMGLGLANLINLLNPGIVILSGALVKSSKLFYEICTSVASKKCCSNGGKVFFSREGQFEDNSISVGAAALIIEDCLEIS